jgi:hypothetical protein
MATAIYDDIGKLAGTEQGGVVTPHNEDLASWLSGGVPGKQGVIAGAYIVDQDTVVPPTDPMFGLALLDHFDSLDWVVTPMPDGHLVQNIFCATGQGGGRDATCRRSDFSLPEQPNFISSQKANVEANKKALTEINGLAVDAAGGNKSAMVALENHPITPSPKLQVYKAQLVAAAKAHAEENGPKPGFPDPKEVKVVGSLPGSTHPEEVEDKDGKHWVMKKGGGQAESEIDADNAYRAAGLSVPKSSMSGGKKFSEFIEGAKTLEQWENENWNKGAAITNMHAEIAKGFVADALFANRDAIGLVKDNILIKDGVPYRVDNGGSFNYRAGGKIKDEAHGGVFGEHSDELKNLRDPSKNSSAADVYKNLTQWNIGQQAVDLLGNRKEILGAIKNPETKKMMEKRFDNLIDDVKKYYPDAAVYSLPFKAYVDAEKAKAAAVTPKTTPLKAAQEVMKDWSKTGSAKELKDWAKGIPGAGKFLTAINMKKLSKLNPDGMDGVKAAGVLVIPKLHYMNHLLLKAGKTPEQLAADKAQHAKINTEKNQEFCDLMKAHAPPGTVITQKVIHKKEMSEAEDIKLGVVTPGLTPTKPAEPQDVITGKHVVVHGRVMPEADEKTHNAWRKTLTDAEHSSIWNWKGSSAHTRKQVIAATGSDGKIDYSKLDNQARTFMGAINKEPSVSGVFYRGIGGQYAVKKAEEIIENWKKGITGFVDPAPHNMSYNTSTPKSFSDGKILLRIKTSNGRPTVNEDSHHHESEVVGYPGTIYNITKVVENAIVGTSKMKVYVEMEEVKGAAPHTQYADGTIEYRKK